MRRRSPPSCFGEVEGLNRGAWTAQEDELLTSYIMVHGEGKWSHVPIRAGLNRSGKSCRLPWLNYLRPDIKRGNITHDEEDLIIRLHKLLGNRWSLIAGRLPGRTDNEIKNYWNTTLAKKLRTESGATTSSEPRSSSSKSSESDDICHRPQVIQTKAGKCKNLVIRHPPNCPEETSTVNSVTSDRLGFDEAHNHLGPQFTNQFLQAAVDVEYVINDELQDELNGVDFFRELNLENSIAMAMDARADEFTPIDELIGNYGTADGFRNIGTMDLDSMQFMLD